MELAIFQSAGGGLTSDARLAMLDAAIEGQSLDLVLCPELFMSGYNIGGTFRDLAEPADAAFSTKMAALALRHNTAIAYGYPEASGDLIYNAVQLIDAHGVRRANHRKQVPAPHSFEEGIFAPGDQTTWIDMGGLRIGLIICYEVELPECLRLAAKAGVDLMLAPTALGVDWSVIAEKMVPTRALENGMWLAYANHAGSENGQVYLGGSRIVAPNGHEVAVAGSDQTLIRASIDKAEVARMRARLPYLRDAPRIV
ncbi:MAG: carbon-nitrogen hydrolase family protein [Roseovarius sp.]